MLYGKHQTSLALNVVSAFRGSRHRDKPYHYSFLPKVRAAYQRLPDENESFELGKNPFAGDSPRERSSTDKLAQKVRSVIADQKQPEPRASEPTPVFQSYLKDDPRNPKPSRTYPPEAPASLDQPPVPRRPFFTFNPIESSSRQNLRPRQARKGG